MKAVAAAGVVEVGAAAKVAGVVEVEVKAAGVVRVEAVEAAAMGKLGMGVKAVAAAAGAVGSRLAWRRNRAPWTLAERRRR